MNRAAKALLTALALCSLVSCKPQATPPASDIENSESNPTETASLSDSPDSTVRFSIEQPGKVSLSIYSEDGVQVRELLRGHQMDAGNHEVSWDGRDRLGRPAPSGKYIWKLLQTQGMKAEYVMSVGVSSGPIIWTGQHGGPSAVAADPASIYIGGQGNEGPPAVVKIDWQGKVLWTSKPLEPGFSGATDFALDATHLHQSYGRHSGTIYTAESATGEIVGEFRFRVPLRKILLGGDGCASYDAKRGYGWLDPTGVNADKDGHHGRALAGNQKRAFAIDVPKSAVTHPMPRFYVRFSLGSREPHAGTGFQITLPGEGIRWIKYDPLKDGPHFIVEAIGETPDGQLKIEFSGVSPNQPWDFDVSEVEVFAVANRVACGGGQLVAGSVGGNQVVWLDPHADSLPEGVVLDDPLKGDLAYVAGFPHIKGLPGEFQSTDRRALQGVFPGTSERHAAFWGIKREGYSLDLKLPPGQSQQLALYFADLDRAGRKPEIKIVDGETGVILDQRAAVDVGEGRYLIWNVTGHVKLVIGGSMPVLNGIFFDPAPSVPPKESDTVNHAVFVGEDTKTAGDWQGTYGKLGYRLPGARGRVIAAAPVEGLQDVAMTPEGSVLAISDRSIVSLDQQNPRPVVRISGLEDPVALAVDPTTGDLFVAEGGSRQQVVRYDKNYQKTGEFGRRGGRKSGRYNPEDFLDISNISADQRGGFVVTEWLSPPRRTAHFDASGKLLKEWYGGQLFYNQITLDPRDASRVWFMSQWGTFVEAEIDFANRSWKVRSTYDLKSDLDSTMHGPLYNGNAVTVVYKDVDGSGNEQKLLWSDAHPGLLLRIDEASGRLIPVSAMDVFQASAARLTDHVWEMASKRDGRPRSVLDAGYSWVDLNLDGEVQLEEVTLMDKERRKHYPTWRPALLGKDWSFYHKRAWGAGPIYRKYPPVKFTETGIPVWSWDHYEDGPDSKYGLLNDLYQDESGNLYEIVVRGGEGDGYYTRAASPLWDAHGWGWPATNADATAFIKRDPSGRILWQVGPHAARRPHPPGQLSYPATIAGIVDDVIGVTDKAVNPCEFWTTDGLYAGGLFDRRAEDGLGQHVYTWWRVDPKNQEDFNNRALIQYDMQAALLFRGTDGQVYYLGSGWNDFPMYRVTGFDQFSRQEGTVRLEEPTQIPDPSGVGLRGEYFESSDLSGNATLVETGGVWFGSPKLDSEGKVSRMDWPQAVDPRKPLSVRWTGSVEPRFSEEYTFGVYARSAGARLWVGDKLVIDEWGDKIKAPDGGKFFSPGIRLEAGKPVPLKLEFRSLKNQPPPEAHLVWESLSQPIEHIPSALLYPNE